ncbi:hypothetical protein [Neobacillus mesonae]|uniref:hypothetical protein n=1 Tax=Neobacillus mesonae TaxID=1193713 RepID=UPI00203B430D|nr:hypothetical protein [Neobacillus mesonae]MCM3568016.1 hypothetical protein [Neobacillus mesonae]
MLEDFEVNHLFEGSAKEHPHFSLSVDGSRYKGMIHGDKVHWYHPHPKQTLEEEHVDAIEDEVFNKMTDYLDQ